MKKVVILSLAAVLAAAPAFAIILGSKHDLSSATGPGIKAASGAETCVFCHTPHGAETAGLAPLWNRALPVGGFAATDLYNSATLTNASRPTLVEPKVTLSDALLCLSCHDGTTLVGGLLNPSNLDGMPADGNLSTGTAGEMIIDDGANSLTNDHPIGMVYADAAGSDAGLEPAVTMPLPLYDGGVMWCSTCHDVHAEAGFQPFLNLSNAGSALCTTCHLK